jgi:nucleoside 2-deoxyribosyltransferase
MASEKIYKVFVSSTYEDLREERAAVEKGLLQIDCWPVGMELFPAADAETWDFIKSQIDDSDYYVVVIAGRYGSQGPDGISFTEMEYDYAIAQGKPAIGFVHADPGSIAVSKTETSAEARTKLEKFIEKIKKRPVRLFKNPDDLALQVTTSFNWLKRNRPAVGYVRADAAVDFKRYSEVLEENSKLKEALSAAQQLSPFPAHEKQIQLAIAQVIGRIKSDPEPIRTLDCSLMEALKAVAEAALLYEYENQVLNYAAKLLLGEPESKDSLLGFQAASVRTLRREFVLYGLFEIGHEDRSHYSPPDKSSVTQTVTTWKLTDYGRRQLAAIAP